MHFFEIGRLLSFSLFKIPTTLWCNYTGSLARIRLPMKFGQTTKCKLTEPSTPVFEQLSFWSLDAVCSSNRTWLKHDECPDSSTVFRAAEYWLETKCNCAITLILKSRITRRKSSRIQLVFNTVLIRNDMIDTLALDHFLTCQCQWLYVIDDGEPDVWRFTYLSN